MAVAVAVAVAVIMIMAMPMTTTTMIRCLMRILKNTPTSNSIQKDCAQIVGFLNQIVRTSDQHPGDIVKQRDASIATGGMRT